MAEEGSRIRKSIDRFIIRTVVVLVLVFSLCGLATIVLYAQLSHADNKSQAAVVKTQEKPRIPSPVAAVPVVPLPDFKLPPVQDGIVPVISRIPTKLPVVYLTIDDGANKTQQEVDLLAKNNIKASLFLSDLFIRSDPQFFSAIVKQGSVVEDHTLSHDISLTDRPYDVQKEEICGMSDHIVQYYGNRPTLFRPPGGAYSDSLRRAAADCGVKAIVDWHAKVNGGAVQYQEGDTLLPGDIVLMHFRPEFAQDLAAFIDAKNAAGLQTQLLESVLNQ